MVRAIPDSTPLSGQHPGGDEAVAFEVEAYRRLNAVYHQLLSNDPLAEVLERVGDVVAGLIPSQALLIARVDHEREHLVPLVVRGAWSDEVMEMRPRIGEGMIGWVAAHGKPALVNDAVTDPRVSHVAGTPQDEPEAIMCAPLIAHGRVIGALSIYREGVGNTFDPSELEIATSFADAVTLALVNAQRREELEQLTRTDDLTHALNRRGLEQRYISARALAAETPTPIAVIELDFDDFKSINDRHGHHIGDRVLRHVADLLHSHARAGDTVARLGGDEFVVLLPNTALQEAKEVAARIRDACCGATLIAGGGRVDISLSVGVAARVAPSSLEQLLVAADEHMYLCKSTNRTVGDASGAFPRYREGSSAEAN